MSTHWSEMCRVSGAMDFQDQSNVSVKPRQLRVHTGSGRHTGETLPAHQWPGSQSQFEGLLDRAWMWRPSRCTAYHASQHHAELPPASRARPLFQRLPFQRIAVPHLRSLGRSTAAFEPPRPVRSSLTRQCLALCIANMREHSHTTFTTLMEAYVAAAGGLNRELQNTQSEVGGRDEHVAAVMCLCMTDMIMPHKGTDWWHHSDGLSKLLQLSPPQSYASGSRHELFVGFRPLLVIQAFASRKPTFLAHDDWKVRPSSEERASPMQQLLGKAAELPSILAQVDAAQHSLALGNSDASESTIRRLAASYRSLEQWFQSSRADCSSDFSYC